MQASRRLMLLLALPAVLLLAAPAVRADAVAEVQAATAKWIDAFNRKSARDIVALYAKDAVFFGTSSPVLRDSPEMVQDYFKALPTFGDATISIGDQRVQVFGDVAIHTGYYTRAFMQGGALVKNPARFTFVYAKRNGQWQIVNHHSSALPVPP
jgi:uncharacterized protein (TIGR02246 family)